MPVLAFYKGGSSWIDRVITYVTRSPYSHVELICLPFRSLDNGDIYANSHSASSRDGGVRSKLITFDAKKWDFVDVSWSAPMPGSFIVNLHGAKYDYAGIVMSQFFNLRRQNDARWFCSEICAAAIGLSNPESYSPGKLKDTVENINAIVERCATPPTSPKP